MSASSSVPIASPVFATMGLGTPMPQGSKRVAQILQEDFRAFFSCVGARPSYVAQPGPILTTLGSIEHQAASRILSQTLLIGRTRTNGKRADGEKQPTIGSSDDCDLNIRQSPRPADDGISGAPKMAVQGSPTGPVFHSAHAITPAGEREGGQVSSASAFVSATASALALPDPFSLVDGASAGDAGRTLPVPTPFPSIDNGSAGDEAQSLFRSSSSIESVSVGATSASASASVAPLRLPLSLFDPLAAPQAGGAQVGTSMATSLLTHDATRGSTAPSAQIEQRVGSTSASASASASSSESLSFGHDVYQPYSYAPLGDVYPVPPETTSSVATEATPHSSTQVAKKRVAGAKKRKANPNQSHSKKSGKKSKSSKKKGRSDFS